MNQQPPEKSAPADAKGLDVHSIFYTIQGEGPFAGRPAVFVRLAGCNLQCPLCDTEYTDGRRRMGEHEVLKSVSAFGGFPIKEDQPLVVITGGEPMRQDLGMLVWMLSANRYHVQIETNGTLYQELPWDDVTIVCSPKTGSVNKQLAPRVAAYKYVLHAEDVAFDGLPKTALGHPNSGLLARPADDFSGTIYLQPVDDHSMIPVLKSRHLKACIDSCMLHGYTLGLQIHKLIALE